MTTIMKHILFGLFILLGAGLLACNSNDAVLQSGPQSNGVVQNVTSDGITGNSSERCLEPDNMPEKSSTNGGLFA